jgi:hypothetical protein
VQGSDFWWRVRLSLRLRITGCALPNPETQDEQQTENGYHCGFTQQSFHDLQVRVLSGWHSIDYDIRKLIKAG